MNHDDVVTRFANRAVNKRAGGVFWNGCRVWCTPDTIYSYGIHFPMAHYIGQVDGKHYFIKNGDRFSSSTSGHQSLVQRRCSGPTVSRNALRAAGIDMYDLQLPGEELNPHKDLILDWVEDCREYIYRVKETGNFYKGGLYEYGKEDETPEPFQIPKQGMFIPYAKTENDVFPEIQEGYWHILGAILIQTRKNKFYLSSLDDSRYFVAELSKPARTVEQAFRGLKPRVVKEAERAGLEVVRQGEWFFVPTPYEGHRALADMFHIRTIKEFKKKAQIRPLPYDKNHTHRHVCRGIARGKTIYVCGTVRHTGGEHPRVKLGDRWHRAYRNTEIQSWSQSGSFD